MEFRTLSPGPAEDNTQGGQWGGEAGLDDRPGHAQHQVHAGADPRCHPKVDAEINFNLDNVTF